MDISGKIIEICEPITGKSKKGEWSKQGIVIEMEDGEYKKQVYMTTWNGKVDLSDLSVGQDIQAFINVSSREYEKKWYSDIQVWRIEASGASASPAPATAKSEKKEEVNDLPF